jgi:hypothetical protein
MIFQCIYTDCFKCIYTNVSNAVDSDFKPVYTDPNIPVSNDSGKDMDSMIPLHAGFKGYGVRPVQKKVYGEFRGFHADNKKRFTAESFEDFTQIIKKGSRRVSQISRR